MWARIKNWRWALLIAGLLLAGLAYAFWPERVLVDAGSVTRGPMAVGITDDGVTRAEEYYIVSAPVTGYLARIVLEPGDMIARGGLITQMTGRPSSPLDQRSRDELRSALAAARAAEAGTAALLAQSQRDLARAEQLASRGFLPKTQLEAARTKVMAEQSALRQSRAEIARIGSLIANPSGQDSGRPVAVKAPAAGAILAVLNKSEGVVAEGTPLVAIGNPDSIEIVVDLLSREAVRVEPGNRVEITQWGGPEPLIGQVERIEPTGTLKISALGIEEQRVNVIIRFAEQSAAQGARLGHGYQIDATIELWRDDNALRLPIGALFRGTDGQWQVFVIENGRARARTVHLGQINDKHAQLLDGIGEDAQLIVNPSSAIEDGVRVAAR